MIECVLCPNDHRVVERTLLVPVRTGPPAVCAVVWYAGLVVHDTNGKDSISLEAIVALDVRSNASHENKQRFHSPDRFPDCLKELLPTPVDCFAEGRLADHLLLVEGLQSWARNHLTPAGNGPGISGTYCWAKYLEAMTIRSESSEDTPLSGNPYSD